MTNKVRAVFEDEADRERLAMMVLRNGGNLRLIGDTGTGKTTFVHYLCEKNGWRLYETVLSGDASRWELLVTDTIKRGETTPRKGIIVQWLEDRKLGVKVLYLDGFNYPPSNILSIIESLADFRENIYVAELQETLARTKEHYIIISQNPYEKAGYAGTFRSNIAQVRRFETLYFDYLSRIAETELIKRTHPKLTFAVCNKLAHFSEKTRILYTRGELSAPITTGNVLKYAGMLADTDSKATLNDILEIAKGLFLREEHDKIESSFGADENGRV
jgi:MoxR-like ATPase